MSTARLGLKRIQFGHGFSWLFIAFALTTTFECLILTFAPGDRHQEYSHMGEWSLLGLHAGLTGVLLLPVVEELIFRGVIFASIARRFGLVTGIIVSSIIFASVHIESDLWAIVCIAFSGATYALLYWKTGSIIPAIILHVLNNGMAFVAEYKLALWGLPVVMACVGVTLAYLLLIAREHAAPRPLLSEELKKSIMDLL
jgi:membrane protease YdiL (CAAX protease family)